MRKGRIEPRVAMAVSWEDIDARIRTAEREIVRLADGPFQRLEGPMERLVAVRPRIPGIDCVRLLKQIGALLRPLLAWDSGLAQGLPEELLRRARRVHSSETLSDDLDFFLTPPENDELDYGTTTTELRKIVLAKKRPARDQDLVSPALQGAMSELQAIRVRLQGLDLEKTRSRKTDEAVAGLLGVIGGLRDDLVFPSDGAGQAKPAVRSRDRSRR